MAKASTATTVDSDEIARFNALAASWWDPKGPMAPLHAMAPARMAFITEQLGQPGVTPALKELQLLDIGCGAGLVSEPLARLGAAVTGADAAPENIAAARAHAAQGGLDIRYRVASIEMLADEAPAAFDAVVALEIIEHVADVKAFLANCRAVVKPGGRLIISTLNRTAASFAVAIVGAEYVARLLPRGTHDWRKFVTPKELEKAAGDAGWSAPVVRGMTVEPRTRAWRLGGSTAVNYIAALTAA
jgi:2-polyprenyl-6-hydroxyphenyl methylase/3-demethylubiquinone-9 3-methyltransferase